LINTARYKKQNTIQISINVKRCTEGVLREAYIGHNSTTNSFVTIVNRALGADLLLLKQDMYNTATVYRVIPLLIYYNFLLFNEKLKTSLH
jgi:hypothetical protein